MEAIKKELKEMQKKFLKAFNYNWEILMYDLFFQQEQFISGNRLRPQIVLIGYLASKSDFSLDDSEYDKLSKLSLPIELIHKSSLMLDDLIDGDPARHGKNAFHIDYGAENTMMFAVNLLSISIKKLNQFLAENSDCIVLKEKGVDLLSCTMYDMSLGELKELTLSNTNRYDYEKIQEIISLETSPLIANSLLLGYYAGNGSNKDIEDMLHLIGCECGYIFQVMNDLEPFCQQEKLQQHKGRLNTDIIYAKKNIALTLLYNLISDKEKEKLNTASSEKMVNDLLISYFQYYKIRDSFMREVELIHQNIIEQTIALEKQGLNKLWCQAFLYFVNIIINECKQRLT